MKRLILATALLATLGGCGILGGRKENKPKTAVLGERIPVLSAEGSAEVDPGITDVAVTVPEAAVNADWTQSGGNAQKSMGHLALGQTLSRAFTVTVPGSSGKARLAASPIVADGKLFVMGTDATVYAFDAQSGAQAWRTSLASESKDERAASFGGGVSFDGGRLYASTGSGEAAALDPANGSIVWRKRPGGPLRGAPSVAGGQVYVVTQDNQLFALRADNGETVWNEAGTLQQSGVFGVAAPAIGQGTVVAGFSSGELNAYRYENGRIVWQDALSRTSISTAVAALSDIDADPVIDQGRVFAVGQGGRMVSLELVTGQRIWEVNVAGIATPWVAGDWVFVVTDESKLLCIARSNGKVRWMTQLQRYRGDKRKNGPVNWVGPVLAGGRLILASTQGQMVQVNPADGTVSSTTKLGDPVYLSPVVANNTLYILDNKGRITARR